MPRKILVSDTGGTFTVTIPDNAKITFGPAIPFPARQEQRAAFQPADRSYALRIYIGSKENLYAVFPDVKGFRDLSLEVESTDQDDSDIEMSETLDGAEPHPRTRRSRTASRQAPTMRPRRNGVSQNLEQGFREYLDEFRTRIEGPFTAGAFPGPIPPPVHTAPQPAVSTDASTRTDTGTTGASTTLHLDDPF